MPKLAIATRLLQLSLGVPLSIGVAFSFGGNFGLAQEAGKVRATDWPLWRGPQQNGQSIEKGLPATFSVEGENLLWRKEEYATRSTPERINRAIAAAREVGAPGSGDNGRDAYLNAIAGIDFGDDPAEGLVRGRTFFHGRLGFTFTAPEGFTLKARARQP